MSGGGATNSLMDAVRFKQHAKEADITNSAVELPTLERSDLPHCPECQRGLLRPGVVWFGESLPSDVLSRIDEHLEDPIDLMLVIGTSAKVFPAAGYIELAQNQGARVAVFNTDRAHENPSRDWFFEGDATELVPELFEPVIGKV